MLIPLLFLPPSPLVLTPSFPQIAKLSIIPTVCVLEAIINAKTYTRSIIFSVVVVVLGVGICTVTDVSINLMGLIAAAVAVVTTAVQQIVSVGLKVWEIRCVD